MDEISASLADPDLSPPVVAARIAISVRYLHRLFAEQGTTFGRVLLQRRLVEVRRKLADPTFDHLTITELALAAGFSDPAHFSRAFKAAFGMTALAFRRSA
jgi:AraC-like DNA-binding protein